MPIVTAARSEIRIVDNASPSTVTRRRPAAMIGALLVGFLEAIVGAIPFLGQRYVMFATFLFIIIVLIIRPRGIGGLLDDTRE